MYLFNFLFKKILLSLKNKEQIKIEGKRRRIKEAKYTIIA
jgi:hypothetical protein